MNGKMNGKIFNLDSICMSKCANVHYMDEGNHEILLNYPASRTHSTDERTVRTQEHLSE